MIYSSFCNTFQIYHNTVRKEHNHENSTFQNSTQKLFIKHYRNKDKTTIHIYIYHIPYISCNSM